MSLDLNTTTIFQKNYQSTKRIVVNQGGTGSSKGYSLCQLFMVRCFELKNKTLSVCRKTLPALRATAMKDFFNILKEAGIYNPGDHNKTENTYQLNSNTIEFFSVDDPQKIRSRRRDLLWCNEVNEFTLEDFRQLSMRTSGQIFMDFNPSDEYHWVWDQILTRPDAELIISTYLDNPFLPAEIIREIESYKDKDDNYWNIYGLGLKGIKKNIIYSHWQLCDKMPDNLDFDIYGLDFGYNHPTALVHIGFKDDAVYWEEVFYQSYLNNSDRIELLKESKIDADKEIYADSEAPEFIKEIAEAGFNVIGAQKEKGSVKAGIDIIKGRKFFIVKPSPNILREVKNYSWKVKGEQILDEPSKVNDDALDAGRYAIYTHLKNNNDTMLTIF